ncbi:SH3 domain-containing protein [Pseudonocardia abyssalis]|uniref:SH3 domain-containing protein n=1 Tax=Pseudonocardia abyssalis TaxID=2792008 RepID=A0ABS6UQ51_9PSEU|nr:SH3 domain-containing protein [Pseudonocardia abyssalis]MBW0114733.1 SH3 domain-containing protein [Pseudonocardia abyssalis]MBW0134340.1 SH3 domain-containing protein [Pseudonocardia abyssalis]
MMARPGRTAAVVGGLVAFGAITLMGMLAGSAAAVTPGRCTENVNVRAEPSSTSRIVALCEQGTAVETGRTSNGFVQLTDLGGWASTDYVSVDGSAPTSGNSTPRSGSTPRTTDSADRTADRTADNTGDSADESTTRAPRSTASPSASSDDDASDSTSETTGSSSSDSSSDEEQESAGGGLLG